MTTTETQFTNTDTDSFDFVRRLNSGEVTEVQGREVWSRFGGQAVGFVSQNGSVSVNVRGRDRRTQGTVWVKVGQTVTFR